MNGTKLRGRPRKANVRDVTLHLHLETGKHDDILAWLDTVPKGQRAAAAILAWRAGGIVTPGAVSADNAEEDIDTLIANFR